MTEAPTLQLVFVDALFLLVAGGMGVWFRVWLGQQTRRFDERLEILEKQQQGLERLTERLSAACRIIERTSSSVARPSLGEAPASVPSPSPRRATAAPPVRRGEPVNSAPRPETEPHREWEEMAERSREAYKRARQLLERGMSTTDVARQVGLGVAEVNVLKRMRDAAR